MGVARAAIRERLRTRWWPSSWRPDAPTTPARVPTNDPVLDHLPGEAVLVDGRWLVSLRTYCDVSTQGAEVIPLPCT